jgi:hypothetical protein
MEQIAPSNGNKLFSKREASSDPRIRKTKNKKQKKQQAESFITHQKLFLGPSPSPDLERHS